MAYPLSVVLPLYNEARRLAGAVPENVSALRRDLEQNFKGVLQSQLTRLDLVTREEFDVQSAVLRRTREKLAALEQRLAEVLMATATYTHFCIEHVHGHHKRVATPEDPASARVGESLYAFLPRTLVGSWRSAWLIEVERLGRRGHVPVARVP